MAYEQHLTRGLQEAIESTPIEDGKLRFSVDQARLFLDLKDERIEFTDFVKGLTRDEILLLENPLPKIYLAADTLQFMIYHAGIWRTFGVKGEKGDPGISAGFGEPSGQIISDATGVTSVDILTSGPDTAKIFNFTFRNIKGAPGEGFDLYKTYPSVAAMNADAANVPEGKFVMIASDPEDPDNSKIYIKNSEGTFTFVNDLSGAQGIQGPPGADGLTPAFQIGTVTTGNPGSSASATITGTTEIPVLNLVIPRGDTGPTGAGLDSMNKNGNNASDIVSFTNTELLSLPTGSIDCGPENDVNPSDHSISVGENNTVNGICSAGFGKNVEASRDFSFATGYYSISGYNYQTVIGKNNKNKSDTVFEVGWGSDNSSGRKNVFEIYNDGKISVDDGITKIDLNNIGGGGTWTSPVTQVIGDTSCTITNAAITTSSVIDAYSETASGKPIDIDSIVVTTGQAVLSFDALTEDANFKLWIR